ncbi:MAG: hypothetical protein ACK5N8_00075 [Alphaproteobacteria bacterium]
MNLNIKASKEKGSVIFDLNLEDADRREQIKETMAEVNVMLGISENYIQTGNIPEEMQKAFPEYAQAVQKGEINPKDFSKTSKDKEFSLIMNIATNDWNKNRKDKYSKQINHSVSDYIQNIDNQILSDEKSQTIYDYRRESSPLVWGMIKEKLTTFKYMGEKINLSNHLDEKQFTPTEHTKLKSKNFDKYLTDLNNDLRREHKEAKKTSLTPQTKKQGR